MSAEAVTGDLLATVVAEALETRSGRFGVFVENIPQFDINTFLARLAERTAANTPVRISVLGASSPLALPTDIPSRLALNEEPERANTWRNDEAARAGTSQIVLLVGPAPKVNSLRTTYAAVGTREVRALACKQAIGYAPSPERRTFWQIVERRAEIPLPSIIAALDEIAQVSTAHGPSGLFTTEVRALATLGLIPQRALLDSSGPQQVGQRLRRNRELRTRLLVNRPDDRARLVRAARRSDGSASIAEAALRYIGGTRSALADLDFDEVQAILRATDDAPVIDGSGTSGDGSDGSPRRQRVRVPSALADELALDALVRGDREALAALPTQIAAALEDDPDEDTVTVAGQEFRPRLRPGQNDVVGLCAALVRDDAWGGIVNARGFRDLVTVLRRCASGDLVPVRFDPAATDWPRELIARAAQRGLVPQAMLDAWDQFAARRRCLLPYVADLIDRPLLCLATNADLCTQIDEYLDIYRQIMQQAIELREVLRGRNASQAAHRLAAGVLALDLIVIRTQDEIQAIATPVHPFHLWRWRTIAAALAQTGTTLGPGAIEALRETVTVPPTAAPHVLLSGHIIPTLGQRDVTLVAGGRLGTLPLFADPSARLRGADGAQAFGQLAQRFLQLEPHASAGLRVALVDPPSVSETVRQLLDLDSTLEPESVVPVHIRIYRSRPGLESSQEEQDALDEHSTELRESGGSLVVASRPVSLTEIATELERRPAHLVAVFDPGAGGDLIVTLLDPPPLHPMVLPRAYVYDDFDQRIHVVAAADGGPFGAYHGLFSDLLSRPTTDFVGRRSGTLGAVDELGRVARAVGWIVILDRGIEPSAHPLGCLRLEARVEGARDVVAFTAQLGPVEDLLADAVRAAGLIPEPETVDRLRDDLLEHGGESALSLLRRAGHPGSLVDSRRARGLLGTLAASRWYRHLHPDALVVSLDDAATRRWIVGEDESRRADLLALRSHGDRLIMDLLEVKSWDDPAATVSVGPGVVEGGAVRQIEATIETLQRVLAARDIATVDAARREILRDHLYRAVASHPSSEGFDMGRAVGLLEDLFHGVDARYQGTVVRVQFGGSSSSDDRDGREPLQSPEGFTMRVVDIRERSLVPRREGAVLGHVATDPASDPPVASVSDDFHGNTSLVPESASSSGSAPTGPGHGSATLQASSPVTIDPRDESAIPATSANPSRVRVLIGHSPTQAEVWWDPGLPSARLQNFGFQITGVAGSGKTQLVRALISEISVARLPVLVFDFKNDYTAEFARTSELTVYDLSREGLPFNPLALVPDDEGLVSPGATIQELTGILARVFGLGQIQAGNLRQAMRTIFAEAGLPSDSRRYQPEAVGEAPSFNAIAEALSRERTNAQVMARLDPLFDLGIFPEPGAVGSSFEDVMSGRVVLNLSRLPNDQIKSAISEFLIVRLHGYLLRGEQPRRLARLIVLDEAHRVSKSEKLAALAREGRAFGVGLVVASQFVSDFPVGSSRVDLQACKLEYSIVSPK